MPLTVPPLAPARGGVVGVGIAWTATGTTLPGAGTPTALGATAIDTVFADVGGVTTAPHGLTDGKLKAPVAGTYMARAHVGGYDSGHANAAKVQVEFSFEVNGSVLGMAEFIVQVPSCGTSFNAGGAMEQPLVLAANDLVNVNGKYQNSTSGAAMTAFLYSFSLEQIA